MIKKKVLIKYKGYNKPHTRCSCPDCKRLYHELGVKYNKAKLLEPLIKEE